MIRIIETVSAFDNLKPEWERLQAGEEMRVYQTFQWSRLAWEYELALNPKNALWIVVWTNNRDGDCVIFPFYIDASHTLRFIEDFHSDVCNAVYQPGKNRYYCYKEVAEAIRAETRVKHVWLHKMPGSSEVLHGLGVHLKHSLVYKDNGYSFIDLPKTNDAVNEMQYMNAKDRAVIKSYLRKAADYEFRCISASKGDLFPREILLQLREDLLKNTKRKIAFFPDSLLHFIEAFYQTGRTEIAILERKDRVVALSFRHLKAKRSISWIFMYTDPKAVTLLDAKYIQYKAALEAIRVDFGVGTYAYKLGNFRPQVEVLFSLRNSKTMIGFAKQMIGMNWRFVKDFLKVKLGRAH